MGGTRPVECQALGQDSCLLPEPKLFSAVHQDFQETCSSNREPGLPWNAVERVLLERPDGDAADAGA